MRKERYFINESYAIDIIIGETLNNSYLLFMTTTIIIIWMYFILSFDIHFDFIYRLFQSNYFIR